MGQSDFVGLCGIAGSHILQMSYNEFDMQTLFYVSSTKLGKVVSTQTLPLQDFHGLNTFPSQKFCVRF